MNYIIRKLRQDEISLLDDFLYEAIFVPAGTAPPPKNIIEKSDLQVYIKDFGKSQHDNCLVAEVDSKVVAAVWTRIMNDYGHVSYDTPSFAIAIFQKYRGYGIGTALMLEMLKLLKNRGYKSASLAVQKANYAVKMYKKVGFEIIDENSEEHIMLCNL